MTKPFGAGPVDTVGVNFNLRQSLVPATSSAQPLGVHMEELARRLFWPFTITMVLTFVFFTYSTQLVQMLLDHLGLTAEHMRVYKPTELLMVRLKLSMTLALVVGVPLALWQLFLFAQPGLYEKERHFTLWLVPSSLILFLLGAALALFAMSPLLLEVMISQSEAGPGDTALSLEKTLAPIYTLVVGLGLVFQLPLILSLLIKLELVERETMVKYRPYLYGLFILVATLLAPDPSLVAQLMVFGVLLALFELTLGGAKLKEKLKMRKAKADGS